MREATSVFSEASSLTTTEQPLTFSTSPMTVQVTSRSVMDSFYITNRQAMNEPEIGAACPFFLSSAIFWRPRDLQDWRFF
jgi:hypothetical protein